jgi:hypothetical protein
MDLDLLGNLPRIEVIKELEAFETPEWAIRRMLEKETFLDAVLDPCVGLGAIAAGLKNAGKKVVTCDIKDWGYRLDTQIDFLSLTSYFASWYMGLEKGQFDCVMNPPFSLGMEFFKKAKELGAKKIAMFHRFAFYESQGRRGFFDEFPPNRIWLCGSRATCRRFDLVDSKKTIASTVSHAWFVWEEENKEGVTTIGRIYK